MNAPTPVTEAELSERSKAPRVTADMFEDHIACVNFINVGDAVIKLDQPDHPSHHCLTICVIVLKNGFTVTGESSCVSVENFNEEIGQRISLAKARENIWPLLGYALREHMAYGGQTYFAQPAKEQG